MALSNETLCKGYLPAVVSPEIHMLAQMMHSMSLGSHLGREGTMVMSEMRLQAQVTAVIMMMAKMLMLLTIQMKMRGVE
jgi:hypothetical protein